MAKDKENFAEIIVRLARENERLKFENEKLNARITVLEAEKAKS